MPHKPNIKTPVLSAPQTYSILKKKQRMFHLAMFLEPFLVSPSLAAFTHPFWTYFPAHQRATELWSCTKRSSKTLPSPTGSNKPGKTKNGGVVGRTCNIQLGAGLPSKTLGRSRKVWEWIILWWYLRRKMSKHDVGGKIPTVYCIRCGSSTLWMECECEHLKILDLTAGPHLDPSKDPLRKSKGLKSQQTQILLKRASPN